MKNFVCLVLALLFCGCSTGRFAVLTVDLRTPEQLKASEVEGTVVYNYGECTNCAACEKCNGDPLEEPVSSPSIIAPIFDFLKLVKGKVSFFSIEWRNDPCSVAD